MDWRNGKATTRPRDKPFVPPVNVGYGHEDDASSYHHPYEQSDRPLTHHDDDDPQSPFNDPPSTRFGGNSPLPAGAGRPSMDTYGAFSDPLPSGYDNPPPRVEGVSRTMQFADPAYNNPYDRVRANIGGGPPPY
jgi:hypothetical protein